MNGLKEFLESSTIHGLTYISTTRKYVRLFWIIVVIAGFSGAGYMINESFEAWNKSPTKTTVETYPISEITFPKITVCPPKNTYTDLNYDLMRTENMILDDDIRDQLIDYAAELIWDPEGLKNSIMMNWNKLQDIDRYQNWYHGYTKIDIRPTSFSHDETLLETSASYGTISTQYFNETFDVGKIDTRIEYTVAIYSIPDKTIRNNTNITLHINIEKISMEHVSSGGENLQIKLHNESYKQAEYVHGAYVTKAYNPPGMSKYILNIHKHVLEWQREVRLEEVEKQKLDLMPGFRVNWYYSGMENIKMSPYAKFYNNTDSEAFVR